MYLKWSNNLDDPPFREPPFRTGTQLSTFNISIANVHWYEQISVTKCVRLTVRVSDYFPTESFLEANNKMFSGSGSIWRRKNRWCPNNRNLFRPHHQANGGSLPISRFRIWPLHKSQIINNKCCSIGSTFGQVIPGATGCIDPYDWLVWNLW